MSEQLVIEKALRNLEIIGCKVGIIDAQGNVYGGFDLVPVKEKKVAKRAPSKYPRGTISGYLAPYLDLLTEVGDVIEIPFDPRFETNNMIGSISSYMIHRFGKGSCKVETLTEKNTFRTYRIENSFEQLEKVFG